MTGGSLFLLLLASTEQQPVPEGYGIALFKMLAALVLVCMLAYLLLRLARRYLAGTRGQGRLLEVLERCSLSGRQSLWIVRVGDRTFLIGSSDSRLTKLAELELDLEVEQAKAPTRSFIEIIKQGSFIKSPNSERDDQGVNKGSSGELK